MLAAAAVVSMLENCSWLWHTQASSVVKLLSKRWRIPIGARLEGPKLEPEEPIAEVGFPTADQGFPNIQGTLFGFYGI